MKCPDCGSEVETIQWNDGDEIHRVSICKKCGKKISWKH